MAIVDGYRQDILEHIPKLTEVAQKARIILEIGTAEGYGSTKAFNAGFEQNKDGLLWIGLDLNSEQLTNVPTDPRFRMITGSSIDTTIVEAVETMLTQEATKRGDNVVLADVIFIDTEHTPEQLKAELNLWGKFASSDVTWLFHDTYMNGEYHPMTDEIKTYAEANGYIYSDYSITCNGLGIMTRKTLTGN